MKPDFNENRININPDNPEQPPIDPKIAIVKTRLTEDARLINDRLRADTAEEAFPNCYIWEIAYGSPDRLKWVSITDIMLTREDYAQMNLPRELKGHDRIIPLSIQQYTTPGIVIHNGDNTKRTEVWISLDEEIPTVYELIKENGEPHTFNNRVTGKEQVVKRPDLLPDIMDAVISDNRYIK